MKIFYEKTFRKLHKFNTPIVKISIEVNKKLFFHIFISNNLLSAKFVNHRTFEFFY